MPHEKTEMNASRLTLASLLLLLVGLPLLWPLGSLLDARVVLLARNTAVLVLLVLALALPPGVLLAVLLGRTDLPFRRTGWGLLTASLFVPLPLVVSGWQGLIGAGGFAPLAAWDALAWSPWAAGMGPAAWIHAVVGLPWVALLVGRGLAGVDRALEEDELLHGGPWSVLWRVSLPRSKAVVAAAMLWLAVQTATEITVTDLMQVRTFAEEVYTQFVAPQRDPTNPDPLRRAVGAALFSVVPFVALVLLLAPRLARSLPAGGVAYRPALAVRLGWWRWPLAVLVLLGVGSLVLVPAAGLVWKAGLAGAPPVWSVTSLYGQMKATLQSDGGLLGRALVLGAVTGMTCAGLAFVGCWLARESRWLSGLLLVLLAVAWVMPGPIVGLGLKGVLQALLEATGWPRPLAVLLWYGPSSLPLWWAYVVRLLPFAAAIVWPVVRLTPRSLVELARTDGAGVAGELRSVAWPAAWRAVLLATMAVAVLSLGELAAGKLVSTPGAEGYAEALFSQMHYGVGPDLAARSLWLLAVAALGAAAVGWLGSRR